MISPAMPDAEKIEPEPEVMTMPVDLVDVLIYTNRSFWITLEDGEMAAETTKRLLDAKGIQTEITKDDTYVREWMLETTGDGNTNVIVLYGVLPASVYGAGNSQPDGSIAENWIETTDGDTILNHADYIGFNTDFDVDKVTEWTPEGVGLEIPVGSNQQGGLRNLMDNPNIDLFTAGGGASMTVTSDGMTLTPSLANFDSLRSIPLAQLQGEWFAEKVFASDTGNAEATYADPVIVRDGDRGRLAIVHATIEHEGLLNGAVAAEIIINALLAPPMMEPEPETQLLDPSILTNSLIIAEARVVNTQRPATSNSPTAPQIEGNLPEVTAAAGGTILLPFAYSGTNTLGGCIVYIPGVGAYYEIPYSGAPDDLPSAISVSLPENVTPGIFIDVCYGVYDNQGQTSNYLNTVVRVETPPEIVDFTTDPDMHLYFSFDELDGNRVIDHSKYQNHGMIVGNPQLVEGRFGKALEFNGQTDYVEVPHDDSLIVNKAFTVMAWIKTPRGGGTHSPWQGIIAKGNFPRSYSLYTTSISADAMLSEIVRILGEDLGKSTFEAIAGESVEEGVIPWAHLSTGPLEGSVSMPFVLNEWQHVVAQMDENNVHRYWINGEATDWPALGLDSFHVQASSGLPGANDTGPVRVGNTMENVRHFLGVIDEVRIWRRALSEAEIIEHMQQGLHAE